MNWTLSREDAHHHLLLRYTLQTATSVRGKTGQFCYQGGTEHIDTIHGTVAKAPGPTALTPMICEDGVPEAAIGQRIGRPDAANSILDG
jgi:hypothetical protein